MTFQSNDNANNAKASTNTVLSTKPTSPRRQSSRTSIGHLGRSPRNSTNRLWIQGRQRREFLQHLTQWSLSHDSSPHFQGKISLLPQGSKSREQFELGKSVQCILTDTSFTDARQKVVIRLFPPQTEARNHEKSRIQLERRDSMEPLGVEKTGLHVNDGSSAIEEDDHTTYPNSICTTSGNYKLVVRCGAGWVPAREYFSKVYFTHLDARRIACPGSRTLDESLGKRSWALGPLPLHKDSVTIRPLFRSFLNLPPEIRELILSTAAGLSRSYNLCSDEYGIPKVKTTDTRAPISLATLFGISKAMNQHLVPHIYHSTDFEFGLTGFTNFLWQSGPVNRPEIKRLTFHFGKMALLHCIRWLAPNPIFSLFEPPVATNPRSLQYFWRCQIQDLSKELHLLTLTINIKHIPSTDLPMVVAILNMAFGSATRIRFIETDQDGESKALEKDDERLKFLCEKVSWRDMCWGYYTRHRRYSYFFKFELLRGELEEVEKVMDANKEFFDDSALW